MSFERNEPFGSSTDLISIEGLFDALEDLRDGGISVEGRVVDDESLIVFSGSAKILLSLKPEIEKSDGESEELVELTGSGPVLEIWSEVVYNIGNLTPKRQLDLYQRLAQLRYSYGMPLISGDSLTLWLNLPTTSATNEYLARVAAEVVTWIDVIDDIIAEEWGGLEASDSGPALDQGNTTHARY